MGVKVSVLIPTFNRPKELAKVSLPSVFSQTFQDFEVHVLNDGGAAGVQKRADDCRSKFWFPRKHYFFHNLPSGGKSKAINWAIKNVCAGEYILVVDDDNELHPTYLEETVKAIEEQSAREVAFGNAPWHAVNTGRIVVHDGFTDYAPAFYQLGLGFAAIDWGWLIRKEVFDEIKYDEELSGDEDADFGIQFFKKFRAYALNKPLQTAYANNTGVSYPSEKRLKSLVRFYEKNYQEYVDAGPKDASFLNRFVARNLYLAGRKRDAIRYFWRAFRTWPNRRTATHFLVSLISYKAYYLLMRLEERYWSYVRMNKLNKLCPK